MLIYRFLEYTLSEVEDHDTEDDCWMAIYDNVYDVTKFINEHPGGMIIAVSGPYTIHLKFGTRQISSKSLF
jgi:cytochrome b involved in lipid metabolism